MGSGGRRRGPAWFWMQYDGQSLFTHCARHVSLQSAGPLRANQHCSSCMRIESLRQALPSSPHRSACGVARQTPGHRAPVQPREARRAAPSRPPASTAAPQHSNSCTVLPVSSPRSSPPARTCQGGRVLALRLHNDLHLLAAARLNNAAAGPHAVLLGAGRLDLRADTRHAAAIAVDDAAPRRSGTTTSLRGARAAQARHSTRAHLERHPLPRRVLQRQRARHILAELKPGGRNSGRKVSAAPGGRAVAAVWAAAAGGDQGLAGGG